MHSKNRKYFPDERGEGEGERGAAGGPAPAFLTGARFPLREGSVERAFLSKKSKEGCRSPRFLEMFDVSESKGFFFCLDVGFFFFLGVVKSNDSLDDLSFRKRRVITFRSFFSEAFPKKLEILDSSNDGWMHMDGDYTVSA